MTREPLIETLRRLGAMPRFDVRSFRYAALTDGHGHYLKWHYGDARCPFVINERKRRASGIRVLDNILEFLNTPIADRCRQCAAEVEKLMR